MPPNKTKKPPLMPKKIPVTDIELEKLKTYIQEAIEAANSKNYDKSIEIFSSALRINKNIALIWNNLGIVQWRSRLYSAAIISLKRAIELDKIGNNTWITLGNSLLDAKRTDEALKAYEQAVSISRSSGVLYYKKALALRDKSTMEKIPGLIKKARKLGYQNSDVDFLETYVLLVTGNLRKGFSAYKCRWEAESLSPRHSHIPDWQGEALDGRSLLVWHEQGMGDTIQFSRYLTLDREWEQRLNGPIIFEVQPRLLRVFENSPSLDHVQIIPSRKQSPRADIQIPLLSLPQLCKTDLQTIPDHGPYIMPGAVDDEMKVTFRDDRFKVGICWAGNKEHTGDDTRSISLKEFLPLFEFPQVDFYSLQKGPSAHEIQILGCKSFVEDIPRKFDDFFDDAIAIQQLDLIITVDTAVAHLAAAMGKPTWVLLSCSPDWRWMLKRDDSPWYASARLFRQQTPNDWEKIFKRVRQALKQESVKFIKQSQAVKNNIKQIKKEKLPPRPTHEADAELDKLEDCTQAAIEAANSGDIHKAIELFSKRLQMDRSSAATWANLGIMQRRAKLYDPAIASLRLAVALDSTNSNAWSSLGNALMMRNRFDEALRAHKRALILSPVNGHHHCNKALVLRRKGTLEKAHHALREARKFGYQTSEVDWEESLTYLAAGKLREGFDLYESRWEAKSLSPRHSHIPDWQGEALDGRSLLVWHEQGMGDTIQFSRYLTLDQEWGQRLNGPIIFEVQPLLLRMFQNSPSLDHVQIIPSQKQSPRADIQIPLLSLPQLCKTDLQTIPDHGPYIMSSAVDDEMKGRFPDDRLKVGICWAGSPTHKGNHNRSISLKNFFPLFEFPRMDFYSLQKGPSAHEIQTLGCKAFVEDIATQFDDFSDTAAAIQQLDLIITVDTAVAHLAAAMGKPTWVFISCSPDWRWMLKRDDSPWYTSIRLFRQQMPNDWEKVFKRVQQALESLLKI